MTTIDGGGPSVDSPAKRGSPKARATVGLVVVLAILALAAGVAVSSVDVSKTKTVDFSSCPNNLKPRSESDTASLDITQFQAQLSVTRVLVFNSSDPGVNAVLAKSTPSLYCYFEQSPDKYDVNIGSGKVTLTGQNRVYSFPGFDARVGGWLLHRHGSIYAVSYKNDDCTFSAANQTVSIDMKGNVQNPSSVPVSGNRSSATWLTACGHEVGIDRALSVTERTRLAIAEFLLRNDWSRVLLNILGWLNEWILAIVALVIIVRRRKALVGDFALSIQLMLIALLALLPTVFTGSPNSNITEAIAVPSLFALSALIIAESWRSRILTVGAVFAAWASAIWLETPWVNEGFTLLLVGAAIGLTASRLSRKYGNNSMGARRVAVTLGSILVVAAAFAVGRSVLVTFSDPAGARYIVATFVPLIIVGATLLPIALRSGDDRLPILTPYVGLAAVAWSVVAREAPFTVIRLGSTQLSLPVGSLFLIGLLVWLLSRNRVDDPLKSPRCESLCPAIEGGQLHARTPAEVVSRGIEAPTREDLMDAITTSSVLAIAPVGYLIFTSVVELRERAVEYGASAVFVVSSVALEYAHWVVLGALFIWFGHRLPGSNGFVRALSLGAIWFVPATIVAVLNYWTTGSATRSWTFPGLQDVLFLVTLGVAIDARALKKSTEQSWSNAFARLREAYSLDQARQVALYAIPVALAVLAIGEQVVSGSGVDVVKEALNAGTALAGG